MIKFPRRFLGFPAHKADIDAHMPNIWQTLRTGQYFVPGHTSLDASKAISANTLYAHIIFLPRPMTFDTIKIATASGSAGNLRMGIYNADGTNLYPGTLKLDIGTVDTTATEQDELVISGDVSLDAGLWWLAMVADATPTLRALGRGAWAPLGILDSDIRYFYAGWTSSFSYAALPDPFTAGGSLIAIGDDCPLMALKLKSLD